MVNLLEYILSSAFPPSSSMLMRFVKESGAKGCELNTNPRRKKQPLPFQYRRRRSRLRQPTPPAMVKKRKPPPRSRLPGGSPSEKSPPPPPPPPSLVFATIEGSDSHQVRLPSDPKDREAGEASSAGLSVTEVVDSASDSAKKKSSVVPAQEDITPSTNRKNPARRRKTREKTAAISTEVEEKRKGKQIAKAPIDSAEGTSKKITELRNTLRDMEQITIATSSDTFLWGPVPNRTIPEANFTFTFSDAGEAGSHWRPVPPSIFFFLSHLRRKQNHMKPLLSVMLSLWLLVFYSAAPVTFPAMAVNCFSGESPDEIYSGAFPQLVWTRFVFVPLWRCLLTSSSDLSASVKPPIAIACFSCSRSFQCTDLNSHRLLPSSPAPCPMNPFPKGMTSSALLWCEPSIRSGSCSSDLARFENLDSAPSIGVLWSMVANNSSYFTFKTMVIITSKSEIAKAPTPIIFGRPHKTYRANPSLSTSSFSRQCSISVPTLRCLKLESSSPLKLSFVGKFSQTSSRQGRERSFLISSLSKKRILPPQSFNSSADINNCSMGCLTKFCIMGILNSSFGERPISSFLERSLSTLYSFLWRTLPSTFSIMEKVFQRSDVQTSRATHFLQSPILAEDQIDLKSIRLEALLKKLPIAFHTDIEIEPLFYLSIHDPRSRVSSVLRRQQGDECH
ncbi:hypothetical protein HID58_074052 [Brassica napus]|uniref:Uncharacterized protein n=1 Tax=Brassica napus TaxID=3708 RepID=A0ABQ7YIU2_BRANA|nr:hypothetical protein HID58_074052 [Brassica napus]